ncbi:recombinase family protein [Micromonospora sp. NPDC051300]|uniref:recombinase family protein n=1 Tax=Micromonospora sp. NPDC051300 TaxID=3364286 RepID=UPI0037965904
MKALIYCRQSLDKDGDELAVTRQLDDGRQLARLRGWHVVRELVENDVSAAGRHKRPQFEQVLSSIEAGEVKAVICWDMSRLSRNRRDTLRLLEAGEKARIVLAFVRGSDLDLSTPSGALIADVLSAVSRNEIKVKSDRQQAANRQAAEQGRRVGGRRPFGYGPVIGHEQVVNKLTGEVESREIRDFNAELPEEATALRDAYKDVLRGVPLGRIVRAWNERGLTTTQRGRDGQPAKWSTPSLRAVLLNPRNAGLRYHVDAEKRGAVHPIRARLESIVGPATWPAIVREETWRAVVDILTDPSRTSPGRTGRRMLSGLGLCGVCEATVHAGGGQNRQPGYRCSADYGHVSRRAQPVDDWVGQVVIAWLSRPDASKYLLQEEEDDPGETRTEVRRLRKRLNGLAALHASDEIDDEQLRTGTRTLRKRIAEMERTLVRSERASVLEPLINAPDVEAAWESMDVDRRRAVVEHLMVVKIMPPGRGTRTFRPESVVITPKTAGES